MFKIETIIHTLAENGWLWCKVLFAVYLIILSVMDIKWKKLPFTFLLSGALLAAAGYLCEREIPLMLLAAGGAVGIIFLIISKATGESFGYGDSILILFMGSFLGLWDILSVLLGAFSMAAVFSAFMMVKRGFHRKSSFPFVPFLAAAYMGGIFLGIY